MVIDIINIEDITIFEPKNHPPVPGNGYRVAPGEGSLQRMEPKSTQIHVLRAAGVVQQSEDVAKLLHMLRRDSFRCPSIVERFEPTMFDGPNHIFISIMCRLSLVN